MIDAADENLTRRGLLLEMAFETEGGIPLGQQVRVHRPVRSVTGQAAFPHGFMLKHVRSPLGRMTFQTTLIGRHHGESSTPMRGTLVRVMTVTAV
jgi:hypothetical protein